MGVVSLYAQTRLLPAYHVSRQLSSSLSYDLIYKVSSFSDDVLSSGDVKEFRFAPVDGPTGPGRLCASVTYRCDLSEFFPSPRQSVEGIGTSFRGRAGRPHSWTSGFHRPPGHYATQNHSFSPGYLCFLLSVLLSASDSKYDSGRFSGLLSSSGSPRFGFSRRPSRLSSADNLDDPDCSCPFDFDDVDESGLHYSLDRKKTSSSISQLLPIARKSQDAAVGVLVQMLKTAPPLRLDSRTCMASMSDAQREGSVSVKESEFSMVRSTTDALEELRNYEQLKDLLLTKSKSVTPVH
ncbi:hypothetical protein Bca52824_000692 [Brassica carinata]|uniref:Autophagy-related protein 13 N-terminal domain-containing protein n=1 Tax=Brassica carinata TaxID=52824 RepID=A0A8X8BCE0_BRACI|nr:hypothetical protein Bca52824_000692 [Brassica carinata]